MTQVHALAFGSTLALREQIVEPVIGQIKHARGFWQFSLRGFAKVSHEWALICTVHNLAKRIAQHAA